MGSGDLVAPLVQLGVPARAEPLAFGDVQVTGRGPGDRPVLIGVEIKAIGDLLRCMTDLRFAGHQLLGLLPAYEVPFLLIEGVMTSSPTRELLILKNGHWEVAPFGSRPWRYEDVESWLVSMRRTGLQVVYTADRRGTAAWLSALWSNWSKPWEEHKSHLGIYMKPLDAEAAENPLAVVVEPVTWKMKVAAALGGSTDGGMGIKRARAAISFFRSVRRMVNASEADWRKVDGIGKRMAAGIVAGVIDEERS